jgi:HlyD family secretion protein
MINNGWRPGRVAGVTLLALAACRGRAAEQPDTFQGIVEFQQRVLSFEVPGRVLSLAVDRGDRVEAGALVATLDDTLERQALAARQGELGAAQAQATLVRSGSRAEDVRAMEAQLRSAAAVEAQVTRDLARAEQLAAGGAQTRAVVESLASRVRQATADRQAMEARLLALRRGARPSERAGASAQAEASAAGVRLEEERLRKYQLRTLAAGTVLDRHVEPGEVVGAGSPVFTVADTNHPYVDVFVPQADLAGIAVGVPATVRTDAASGGLAGRVEHVAQRTEFTPRFLFSERERPNLVVRVRVRVDDPGQRLHAGVPAFARLSRAGATHAAGEGRGDAR